MRQRAVPKRERTFQSIQYLRAIAALMVVAYHLKVRVGPMGYRGPWPEWLSCGVDIFFVISGFIMWMTTCERRTGPGDFLLRRLVRIVPLYWVVTAAVVSISLAAPALIGSGRFEFAHAIASFLFVPHLNAATQAFEPVVPQGWTLNYEMEFYVLFAACLLAPVAIRRWAVLASLAALVLIGTAMPRQTVPGFYTSSLILEFGFGVVVANLLAGGFRLPLAASAALGTAGAIGLAATWPLVAAGVPRAWLSGLCAASIVAAAAFGEQERPVGLYLLPRLLGDGSYSVYLIHGIVLTALAHAWTRVAGTGSMAIILFVPVGLVVAAIVGVGLHLLVERPLLAGGRRLIGSRRPLIVPAVAGASTMDTAASDARATHAVISD